MIDTKTNIVSGPDLPFEVPNKTSGEIFLSKIKEGGDRDAFINALTGERLTYNEIVTKTIQLAEGLRNLGLKAGDVIAICSENRLEFPICLLAGMCIGVSVAPLNYAYTIGELQHAISISNPKLVLCSISTVSRIFKLSKKNGIKHILLFGKNRYGSGPKLFDDFIRNTKPVDIQNFNYAPVNAKSDVALILCSSGTTGLPKGVMITHRNLNVTFITIDTFLVKDETRHALVFTPFFHAYGCIGQVNSLALKVKMTFMPKYEDKLYLQSIERHRVTILPLVPPVANFLAKSPLVDQFDLSSLKEIRCGAAPLSKDVIDKVVKRLNVILVQGYGMTELTLAAMVQTNFDIKCGSVGQLMLGLQAKVIDLETGKSLGPNCEGELCFRGDLVMKGYRGNITETTSTIDEDGWLHSGDIGYFDEDEHFYIVDRVKELIKYKGFQVPPAELEALLMEHEAIKDAAVVGLPDERTGEKPLAFVVKQPNVKISAEEIVEYVAARISPQKHLHGGVRFVDEIPKNPTGKILRRELRKLLKAKL